MQDSSECQTIITDLLPQRSKDDHPLTSTGGKQDIEEEEFGYLQILAPVQHHHAQERGSNDMLTTEEQAENTENIYDNDDCFPPEFHAKMRQQEKNRHSSDARTTIQDYLLESLSQRYISSASSSDEEIENLTGKEQPNADTHQRKLSTLIDALDLRPEIRDNAAMMRGRSTGINQQQAKSVKRMKRKKKSSSLMIKPSSEMQQQQQQRGTIWYRPLSTQEELLSSTSPPLQMSLTQKQKMESFEKLLEAHGTPKQDLQRPLKKTDTQKHRERFSRSESTPLGAPHDSPHPLPHPEAALTSNNDDRVIIPETASDKPTILTPILEPKTS